LTFDFRNGAVSLFPHRPALPGCHSALRHGEVEFIPILPLPASVRFYDNIQLVIREIKAQPRTCQFTLEIYIPSLKHAIGRPPHPRCAIIAGPDDDQKLRPLQIESDSAQDPITQSRGLPERCARNSGFFVGVPTGSQSAIRASESSTTVTGFTSMS
jgi:hypothetical protein